MGKRIKTPKIYPEEICEGIVSIVLPTAKDLGMTFVRPQEYYENAHFRGKVFSIDEFKEWWVRNTAPGRESGRFTYCTYFGGFNVPSSALAPLSDGRFGSLSEWEKRLLESVEKFEGRFYLIGTREKGDPETLKHEIGHGFYYTDEEYKQNAQRILRRLDSASRERINQVLAGDGYHPAVFRDERHAYILDGGEDLTEAGIQIPNLGELCRAFTESYERTLSKRKR